MTARRVEYDSLDDPKRIAHLRAKGVPEEIIRYTTGSDRVWVSDLRGVEVNGERVPSETEKREAVERGVAEHRAEQRVAELRASGRSYADIARSFPVID